MPPTTRAAKPADAPAFVSEGTRQDLLSGGRAYDFATSRELTLDGDRVRFATDAEIEERGKPAVAVSSADTAALNPT
jgi:hypothetical protein